MTNYIFCIIKFTKKKYLSLNINNTIIFKKNNYFYPYKIRIIIIKNIKKKPKKIK